MRRLSISRENYMDDQENRKLIICYVGLPGSGKTFQAEKLQKESPSSILFDDVKIEDIGLIAESARIYNTIILTDPWFCDEHCRERSTKKLKETIGNDLIIDWRFFENDIEQCRKNVEFRADGREVNGSLRRFSKIYKVPEGYKPIPVWKPN